MSHRRPGLAGLLWFALLLQNASGQSTLGLIAGRVKDRGTGRELAGARVDLTGTSAAVRTVFTDTDGNYHFADASPGQYQIAVALRGYQPRELYEVRLTVAGFLQVDFELRPLSDVWERGRYRSQVFRNETVLNFFGPDVDPAYSGSFEPERTAAGQLEPSVSDVIDPRMIDALPLSGRDVYTAIVLLPGVASDTSTVRSIGLSVNGQRPTSSNFLLDGVDDNNHVITGPLATLPPEAIEEYRVSTSNFSAEYGGVTGYVANAITRRAGARWHANLYGNLKSSVLDANSFNRNAGGLDNLPYGEAQPGFRAGGPLPWRGWFVSSAFEFFHAHGDLPLQQIMLPTSQFYNLLPAGSFARQLLTSHPPAFWAPASDADAGPVSIEPPYELTRFSWLERADYTPSEGQHVLARVSASRLTNPDFTWTPYGRAPLWQDTTGVALGWDTAWTASFTTDLRLGVHVDRLGWELPNSALPTISGAGMLLPGAPYALGYENRSHTGSLEGGSIWISGKNVLKAGAGWFTTQSLNNFAYEPSGALMFADAASFVSDQPRQFEELVSRTAALQGNLAAATPRALFSYHRAYGYLQEDVRATPSLTVNAGLRAEWFGAPSASSATPVAVLNLPAGAQENAVQQASLTLSTHPLAMRPMTWAGRFGLSYNPPLAGRMFVIRAGYGKFHDALYDNLWSEVAVNDAILRDFQPGNGNNPNLPNPSSPPSYSDFFNLLAFASPMKIPSAQSFYLSLQARPRPHWTLEANGLGSASRHLISTDVLNRFEDVNRPNPLLMADVYYRANDASSNYAALTLSARYQASRGGLRVFYTWSHSIDDQSDPLLGDFLDLGFSNQTDRVGTKYYGAFTLPSDPKADRGNSDFDQRQNFVVFSYWDLPRLQRRSLGFLTRDWRLSQTLVLRSGLPYSVYAGIQNCHPLCNTRADLINPATAYVSGVAIPGGQQVLNPAAFGAPPPETNGNTGRNEFGGPGFWNVDFSLSRTVATIPWIGERARLTLRADAFNLFNHANLQPPVAYWGVNSANSDFGQALYGRTEKTGFAALTPLVENARQIQMILRLDF